MLSLWVALMIQAPTPFCSTNAQGFCRDRVVRYALENANPYPVVHINVALGKVTTIELGGDDMKATGGFVVGNSAMLQADPSEDQSRLFISPLVPRGRSTVDGRELTEQDLVDQRTNVQVELEGGMHVTIDVRFGEEDEAVERLIFDFPERRHESEFVRNRLASAEAQLRLERVRMKEDQEKQVRERAEAQMARDILQRFQCRELRRRTMRDLVALEVNRICRIGDKVHISFKLHNRSRLLFMVGGLEVRKAGTRDSDPAAHVEYGAPAEAVAFNEELQGVVSVPVGQAGQADSFTLTALEDAGRGRRITLEDVSL